MSIVSSDQPERVGGEGPGVVLCPVPVLVRLGGGKIVCFVSTSSELQGW